MRNIASLWKIHFSAIANSIGSTDNRDQVLNALRTVPGHNDVINVHDGGRDASISACADLTNQFLSCWVDLRMCLEKTLAQQL